MCYTILPATSAMKHYDPGAASSETIGIAIAAKAAAIASVGNGTDTNGDEGAAERR